MSEYTESKLVMVLYVLCAKEYRGMYKHTVALKTDDYQI